MAATQEKSTPNGVLFSMAADSMRAFSVQPDHRLVAGRRALKNLLPFLRYCSDVAQNPFSSSLHSVSQCLLLRALLFHHRLI